MDERILQWPKDKGEQKFSGSGTGNSVLAENLGVILKKVGRSKCGVLIAECRMRNAEFPSPRPLPWGEKGRVRGLLNI
jgi:hypothetical protein